MADTRTETDTDSGAVREQGELALSHVRPYCVDGERLTLVRLHQLSGGWSRRSFVLTAAGEAGEREFVVRVRPPGSLLDTDIEVEYRTYALLADEPVPVPAVYGFEPSTDNAFDGAFFVMDRLPGEAPVAWQSGDRAGLEQNWAASGSLGRDLVEILAAIHSVPAERCGSVLATRGFAEVVEHWRGIYAANRLVRDPIVEQAFEWVADRPPPEPQVGLVHGDYRIGNCLVADERIAGVIDWELAHVGDVRFDLGYLSLEYNSGKFLRPRSPLISAVADREWFYAEYERLTGRPLDREVVRTFAVLGALMLISILLTGMASYQRGDNPDIRMAWNRFAVPGLRQDIATLMQW